MEGGKRMQPKLFKSKMALYGDTLTSIADKLEVHRNTLSDKVEGIHAQFTQKEIQFFIDHWNLTPNEVALIFFDKED